MSTIFRYRLKITDVQKVDMPQSAQLLSVGPPRDGSDDLDLWALVDPSLPRIDRMIRIFGTGHPVIGDPGQFVGTVATHGGVFVWHIFDGGET